MSIELTNTLCVHYYLEVVRSRKAARNGMRATSVMHSLGSAAFIGRKIETSVTPAPIAV